MLKVSIITVTFNSERTIVDCLRSIKSQTYSNIEHIVQDGGSFDGTVDIIEENNLPNTKVFVEADDGIYDALNKAIEKCSGDIIGILHSDDTYKNKYIVERVVGCFEDSTYSGVYGDLDHVLDPEGKRVFRHWKSKEFNRKLLKRGWMPPHPALFLRKEVFMKYGNYKTSFSISADYEFMIRILKAQDLKFKYVPEIMVNQRVGGASNGNLKKFTIKLLEDYRVIQEHSLGGLMVLFYKKLAKLGQFLW
ncbi:glycosyltransferase [Planktomarina temperata]|nr:glycosyltransferase [Planktomarina temperata]